MSAVIFPNCPYSFNPQAYTFPFKSTATVWLSPVAISIISFTLSTFVGVSFVYLSPSPNCPLLFTPQDQTSPFDFRAAINPSPISTSGIAMFPSSVTITNIGDITPLGCDALITVLPCCLAVIFPSAVTSAISESITS